MAASHTQTHSSGRITHGARLSEIVIPETETSSLGG